MNLHCLAIKFFGFIIDRIIASYLQVTIFIVWLFFLAYNRVVFEGKNVASVPEEQKKRSRKILKLLQ